jgi:hypothetical protein
MAHSPLGVVSSMGLPSQANLLLCIHFQYCYSLLYIFYFSFPIFYSSPFRDTLHFALILSSCYVFGLVMVDSQHSNTMPLFTQLDNRSHRSYINTIESMLIAGDRNGITAKQIVFQRAFEPPKLEALIRSADDQLVD